MVTSCEGGAAVVLVSVLTCAFMLKAKATHAVPAKSTRTRVHTVIEFIVSSPC
jgi:hypothetical protein